MFKRILVMAIIAMQTLYGWAETEAVDSVVQDSELGWTFWLKYVLFIFIIIFSFKRFGFLSFKGRIGRLKYLLLPLCYKLFGTLLFYLWLLIFSRGDSATSFYDGSILILAIYILPHLSPTVRRLHDLGSSGWTILSVFLPWHIFVLIITYFCYSILSISTNPSLVPFPLKIIYWIFVCLPELILLFKAGERCSNKYGSDPRSGAEPNDETLDDVPKFDVTNIKPKNIESPKKIVIHRGISTCAKKT